MNRKILLLEDDTLLGETLLELLNDAGYQTTLVTTGNAVIDVTYENSFALYIFDINVPDMNGLELLEILREAEDKTPTIFISALVDMTSIAKAFSIGAEDYLKKPFFPQELLIRVNAKFSLPSSSLIYKDLEYTSSTKTLRKNGHVIALGLVQEQLFDLFIHNQNRVLDKEALMECLEKPSPTALRVAITKLKQTTGLDIKNLRGVGYILE